MHEIGHGLHQALGIYHGGQGVMDAYAIQLAADGVHGGSNYAEAMGTRHGRASDFYLYEAFAEDVRLSMKDPNMVPEERREKVRSAITLVAPNVDLDALRLSMRSALGELFGQSLADDSLWDYSCDAASALANILAREERIAEEEEDD